MAVAGTLDGNTLAWVKSEIDATVDNARQALEAYVETPEDESQLRFCLNYMHQVYGTLHMVELYGAGMLAHEMEALTEAVLDNKVKNRDDAFEVIMRGMMQLPDYLEKLQQGQQDYPMILLPLLNDLRAARSAALLSESALFSPELDVDAPIPLGETEESIHSLTRKLRYAYHMGLLDWFREKNSAAGLKKIGAVFDKLRPAANDPDTGRVLWAASGVVEALRDKGIESSIATKLLMGQVDRQFKKIIDNGEFALSTEPPTELLKNLLYYVASSRSEGTLVNEIKDAFQLEGLVPDSETLERARADLSAPNAALMRTVSTVLLEDLTQVKDNLDVFVRAEERNPAMLTQLCEKLDQICDTLDMLGFGDQRVLLQELTVILRAMGSGERAIEDDVLMDVASSLLSIESALQEPVAPVVEEEYDELSAEVSIDDSIIRQFSDPEKRKLVKRVVDEVKVDLDIIKNAFNDYSRTPKHIDVLNDVPGLLDRIRGSLSMLTLDRAADILGSAGSYIQAKILKDAVRPDPHSLDLLADSISSVEYYLESITDSWGHPTAILDVAEQSLSELGVTPGQTLDEPDTVSTAEGTSDQTLVDMQAPDFEEDTRIDIDINDESTAEISLGEISMEVTEPEIPAPDVESASIEDPDPSLSGLTLEGFDEVNEAVQPVTPAHTEALLVATAPTSTGTIADDLDDEIVEIFLEEAEEEHANISRYLPTWENNPDDEETLKDMRRSFHTLKGSGRLVGAADVGEFAWAFENLLNRVIDKTVAISPAVFEILDRARATLPDMLDLFRNGQKPGQEVFTLMAHAEALSKGEPVELDSMAVQVGESSGDETVPEIEFDYDSMSAESGSEELKNRNAVETDSELVNDEASEQLEIAAPSKEFNTPSIDPVLLGIYRKEIDTHLLALREYIDEWKANKDRSANHKLIRALHTLKGSSRTASVPQIAELSNFLEEHVKFLQDHDFDVEQDLITLLEDSGAFVEETVYVLDQDGVSMPDNTELIKRARAMLNDTRNDSPTMQIPVGDSFDDLPEPEPIVSDADVSLVEGEEIELEITPEPGTGPTSFAMDYDEELLEIFLEEGVEILDESDHTLADWIANPDNDEYVKAIQRQLHTLKGGARMAGVTEIGDLSHSIETMLNPVVETRADATDDMFKLLQKAQDRLVGMLDTVRKGERPAPATDLINAMNALSRGESFDESALSSAAPIVDVPEEKSDVTPIEEPELILDSGSEIELPNDPSEFATELSAEPQFENVVPLAGQTPDDHGGGLAEEDQKQVQQRSRAELVRVRAELLDNLVNFAGEVSIYRSRMEQQTNAFRYNLTELDDTVSRLRGQLRQFEIETETQIQFRTEEEGTTSANFDPLEFDRFTQMQTLSRGMMESLNDLDSLRGILTNLTRESETLLLQQSRVNTELQEGLMQTRMVPIAGQIPRLKRIVRQTAEELGKKVELTIHGAENKLDRTILERVMSPIEHMLRNALAHGIEAPEQRIATGKDETGNIHLRFLREGSDIVITVADDGAGINTDAIREKAIERGLLKPDTNASNDDLLEIILQSGFSTAKEVTQIAGRGVGLDVVDNEIKQLGGLLNITTEKGLGATFSISMPMSLSVTRALMVQVAEETYAIPLSGVESVERVNREEIIRMQSETDGTYKWLENDYEYIHLGASMGMCEQTAPPEDHKWLPILLVRSGEHRAAIHIDGMIGSREVVVKPVGPQLSTLRGISGATIMGDGSVVLILDLGVLIRLTSLAHEDAASDVTKKVAPVVVEKRIPIIMVVDDSITVRKVTTRLLERNNFKTISAKDGIDALAQLLDMKPDVMLLDVEMPRMDGFELATNIRNDEHLSSLPIIMITSRTGQKHRDHAMDIGVNIYMGKPYSESELLDNINTMLNLED